MLRQIYEIAFSLKKKKKKKTLEIWGKKLAFHSVLNDGRMKLNQILIGFLKCLLLSMPFQKKKKKLVFNYALFFQFYCII